MDAYTRWPAGRVRHIMEVLQPHLILCSTNLTTKFVVLPFPLVKVFEINTLLFQQFHFYLIMNYYKIGSALQIIKSIYSVGFDKTTLISRIKYCRYLIESNG